MTIDPKILTAEEKAWCDRMAFALAASGDYDPAGALIEAVKLGIPKRRELFGQPEGKCVLHEEVVRDGPSRWSCETHGEPAQPAPAAGEMPEAVRNAVEALRKERYESFWRAYSAPRVELTEELQHVLAYANRWALHTRNAVEKKVGNRNAGEAAALPILDDIAAVLKQAE